MHDSPHHLTIWINTLVTPKKQTHEWNLVTNYRVLNKVIIKRKYSFHCIQDLLDHYNLKHTLASRGHMEVDVSLMHVPTVDKLAMGK